MRTTRVDRNSPVTEEEQVADTVPTADVRTESHFRTVAVRLPVACLFWLLCLTLTAAGHRLYKATVTADRAISADRYRADGAPLVWVGHGAVEEARTRVDGQKDAAAAAVHTLPNSFFWLGSAALFTALGGLMVWSGRWIENGGLQSLVGLFAGHFLWLGAVEFGLDAVGRRLGLAGSMEMVGGKVVGTHGAGILIQMSVVFLVPVFIGLTFHESNRCAVFQWFRRRLPIVSYTGCQWPGGELCGQDSHAVFHDRLVLLRERALAGRLEAGRIRRNRAAADTRGDCRHDAIHGLANCQPGQQGTGTEIQRQWRRCWLDRDRDRSCHAILRRAMAQHDPRVCRDSAGVDDRVDDRVFTQPTQTETRSTRTCTHLPLCCWP